MDDTSVRTKSKGLWSATIVIYIRIVQVQIIDDSFYLLGPKTTRQYSSPRIAAIP